MEKGGTPPSHLHRSPSAARIAFVRQVRLPEPRASRPSVARASLMSIDTGRRERKKEKDRPSGENPY